MLLCRTTVTGRVFLIHICCLVIAASKSLFFSLLGVRRSQLEAGHFVGRVRIFQFAVVGTVSYKSSAQLYGCVCVPYVGTSVCERTFTHISAHHISLRAPLLCVHAFMLLL